MKSDLTKFQRILDYTFQDLQLLMHMMKTQTTTKMLNILT